MKNKYLIALPCFLGSKGFNHKTIFVKAFSINEAIAIARHIRPNDNIGDIKKVNY